MNTHAATKSKQKDWIKTMLKQLIVIACEIDQKTMASSEPRQEYCTPYQLKAQNNKALFKTPSRMLRK